VRTPTLLCLIGVAVVASATLAATRWHDGGNDDETGARPWGTLTLRLVDPSIYVRRTGPRAENFVACATFPQTLHREVCHDGPGPPYSCQSTREPRFVYKTSDAQCKQALVRAGKKPAFSHPSTPDTDGPMLIE
jgi:hypothetical protein